MKPKNSNKEFIPYGPEWEKEMMKFSKKHLIKLLREAYMKIKNEAPF